MTPFPPRMPALSDAFYPPQHRIAEALFNTDEVNVTCPLDKLAADLMTVRLAESIFRPDDFHSCALLSVEQTWTWTRHVPNET